MVGMATAGWTSWAMYTNGAASVPLWPVGRTGRLLPAVHRVASLAKRWLLGTHQGSADRAHLAAYLDEFVFRFNRRGSRSRGMLFYRLLELAVAHAPVRYGQPRRDQASARSAPGTAEDSWTRPEL